MITNYPNPLPSNLPEKSGNNWASDYCPDTFPLYNAQIDYFSGLIDQLDTDIAGWVGTYQKTNVFGANVAFANVANLDQGHQWCDDQSGQVSPYTHALQYREPYAFGFSVNGTSTSLASYPAPAIFHPTITGQQQIAACVKPAVGALVGTTPRRSGPARSGSWPRAGTGFRRSWTDSGSSTAAERRKGRWRLARALARLGGRLARRPDLLAAAP